MEEITMEEIHQKLASMKTVKMFPHTVAQLRDELFDAHQIINHVVAHIRKQDAELQGMISPMLAILSNLSGSLFESHEMMHGIEEE
jgi:hypothetical protein